MLNALKLNPAIEQQKAENTQVLCFTAYSTVNSFQKQVTQSLSKDKVTFVFYVEKSLICSHTCVF